MQRDLFGAAPSTSAETHRLFFALMPDEPVRRALADAAAQLQRQHPAFRARWVRPERYHATLCFLGDYPALPPEIVAKAKRAAAGWRAAPFAWTLDHAASFHGREPPCVLRATVVPEPLLTLWSGLRAALAREGLARQIERRFVPHVTLAYGHREMLDDAPVQPVAWRVDRIDLMHSLVGQGHYQSLGHWLLGEPGQACAKGQV